MRILILKIEPFLEEDSLLGTFVIVSNFNTNSVIENEHNAYSSWNSESFTVGILFKWIRLALDCLP